MEQIWGVCMPPSLQVTNQLVLQGCLCAVSDSALSPFHWPSGIAIDSLPLITGPIVSMCKTLLYLL